MGKISFLALPLILFGAAGLVLLFITPTVTANIHVVDAGLNHDYKLTVNLNYDGSTLLTLKGEVSGVDEDEEQVLYEVDEYGSVPDMIAYPKNTIYMNIIGMSAATLGAIISIFGGIPAVAVIGLIIGIGGAAVCMTANFLLLEFVNLWKVEIATPITQFITFISTGTASEPTYNSFNAGWFGPVIASGIIALGVIVITLVSVTKPKK